MQEIKQLLAITQKLRAQYDRSFSLDGRLVGDIGEVLAAAKYNLELLSENTAVHDAVESETGRKVQIKASFKNYSYFPYGVERTPDYFLSVNILENGELEELFNGPGSFIVEHYIKARGLRDYKMTFYTLSKGRLKLLNDQVPADQKIQLRK
ncbi:DUF6998 domain-containing protein [Flavobacterium aurantiibacter]|uniref:DUF6998 domain-containing protein n=1 Tax=Flavobacterium aurantiibacter TaxID=2023067 RepID=A0A256A6A4_9FLAO|nr:hypothetical protein [Flavobacterium aurantiibacter]OYQ48620.1 hypothetical protein CHX27_02130 [Flavobacterium aurantiibacter]